MKKLNQTGFSLIELLFVLVVLGAMFGLGRYTWGRINSVQAEPVAKSIPATDINAVFEAAKTRVPQTVASLPAGQYPIATTGPSSWRTTDASKWSSGFLAGNLWLTYKHTGAANLKTLASAKTQSLRSQQTNSANHDVGFKMLPSFGEANKVNPSNDTKAVLLKSAGTLASRYNPKVKAIRSWGASNDQDNFSVIMDNMMNNELLMWGAASGGNKDWKQMAIDHANVTKRDFIRADGSVYHRVRYSPKTGAVIAKDNPQGYVTDSTWARGQAWSIAGFTLAYRYTKDTRFLDAARRTSNYFVNNLPADNVPYWDFKAPGTPQGPSAPGGPTSAPRDSSAAAIAAYGLLMMHKLDSDPAKKQAHLQNAEKILKSLLSPQYFANDGVSLLKHGTDNWEFEQSDTGLIYGDYYLLKALDMYKSI